MRKSIYKIMVYAVVILCLNACSSELDIENAVRGDISTKATESDYRCVVEITLEEGGTLAAQLGEQAQEVDKLVISGPFDGDDMKTLRALPKLRAIDMTNAKIIGGKPYWEGDNNKTLKNDTIMTNMFGGNNTVIENLEEIILPNTLKGIDSYAFHRSSANVIKMYEGIKWIGGYAFRECNNLTELVFPQSVEIFEEGTCEYCDNLEKVTLPDYMKKIPEGFFLACQKLKEVQFSANLETIGGRAFAECDLLEKIDFPATLVSLESSAFQGCDLLNNVVIPQGVTKLPSSCFADCGSLNTITLHDQITTIADHVFSNTALESFVVPPLVKRVEEGTFGYCPLKEIDLGNVEFLGHRIFIGCSTLESITIPATVKELDREAFYLTGFTELVIPEGVEKIGHQLVRDCHSLTSITIPSTVTNAGDNLFAECENLNVIYWNTTVALNHSSRKYNPNCLIYLATGNTPVTVGEQNTENIIINGYADRITISSDKGGFFVPQAFTAGKVSYTRTFDFPTYPGEAAGWESISLPFTVQTITHEDGRTLSPFNSEVTNAKPFWLRRLTGDGFENVTAIEANVPYIIAMPNNEQYAPEYNIEGKVTFSASNVDFPITTPELLVKDEGPEYIFCSNFSYLPINSIYYVLNEDTNHRYAGSVFERNLRDAVPFEGYVTNKVGTASSRAFFELFGNKPKTRSFQLLDSKPSIDDM